MNLDDLRGGRVGRALAAEVAFRSLALYFNPPGIDGAEESWDQGNLPPEIEALGSWTDILDVAGRELFRDWRVALNDGRELTVRVAADVGLGAAQISVALSAHGYRFQEHLERTRYHAARLGMPNEAVQAPLTCFAYPRLGLVNRLPGGRMEIVELGSERLIVESVDSLPPSPLEPGVHGVEETSFESWLAGIALLDDVWSGVSRLPDAARKSRSRRPEIWVEGVPYVEQESPEFCVPAVAQMILRFHGAIDPSVRQEEIADRMGTVRAQGSRLGGTLLDNEIEGYASYLGPGRASLDEDLTFGDVRAQIDNAPRRPFKVGNGRHAMVVAGWKAVENGQGQLVRPRLGLYDPAPDRRIRWDWFSPRLFSNFVYVTP